MVSLIPTRTVPFWMPCRVPISDKPAASSSIARSTRCSNASPVAVSCKPLRRRANRSVSSSVSSNWICRLMAEAAIWIFSAASRNEP